MNPVPMTETSMLIFCLLGSRVLHTMAGPTRGRACPSPRAARHPRRRRPCLSLNAPLRFWVDGPDARVLIVLGRWLSCCCGGVLVQERLGLLGFSSSAALWRRAVRPDCSAEGDGADGVQSADPLVSDWPPRW